MKGASSAHFMESLIDCNKLEALKQQDRPLCCHVRHGGFVLWRIERSETSLIVTLSSREELIRDSSPASAGSE